MKTTKCIRFVSSALSGSLLLLAFGATGLVQAAQYTVYSAKIDCGMTRSDADVVRGQYATAVNIHNPNGSEVSFTKLAVLALPERSATIGGMGKPVTEVLGPDQAMYVDCTDMKMLFEGTPLPAHYEGFLVISVAGSAAGPAPQLAVWSKYSARHRTSALDTDPTLADVESFSVVEVPGKTISK